MDKLENLTEDQKKYVIDLTVMLTNTHGQARGVAVIL